MRRSGAGPRNGRESEAAMTDVTVIGGARWCRARGGAVSSGLVALALLTASSLLAAAPASAQSDEMRPVLDRLDRLERDLNLLQRQVYRGKIESGDTDFSAAGGNAPNATGSPQAMPSNVAADLDVRMNSLESEMRNSNGRIEEIRHSVDELKSRLDKLVADVDVRLTAMEQNAARTKTAELGTPPPGGPESGPGSAGASPAPPEAAGGAAMDKGEVALVPPAGAAAATGGEAMAPGAPEGTLPNGTPMQQYEYARSLLAKADYPGAERTLKAFIKTYPNGELTENAEYWLAETYYVRSDYTDAAVTYAEGYKKFPTGPKAPDNLLKLGLSLANLGEGEQACKAFAEIDKKFPNARAEIRDRAAAERKQRACK